jgi:hypothetical protein
MALRLWGLALGVCLAGCGSGDRVVQPPAQDSAPAPVAVSAAQALRLLEWVYDHKSSEAYRRLLAGDFRFDCTWADSAGAEWRGTPSTRDDELVFAMRLFGDPMVAIQMTLDRNFFVYPDPEYAVSDPFGRWHKRIRSPITVVITRANGRLIDLAGHADFALVRGDSAVIADDLIRDGVRPDSTVWYLRRWVDETAGWCDLRTQQPAGRSSAHEEAPADLPRRGFPRTAGSSSGRSAANLDQLQTL